MEEAVDVTASQRPNLQNDEGGVGYEVNERGDDLLSRSACTEGAEEFWSARGCAVRARVSERAYSEAR